MAGEEEKKRENKPGDCKIVIKKYKVKRMKNKSNNKNVH
jgi:hypothetical protein